MMAATGDLFREILWATIFFGLFNAFMMAKGVPEATLFGWLQPFVLKGGVQPHVAGIVAVFSGVCGVLFGIVHQNASLYLVRVVNRSDEVGT